APKTSCELPVLLGKSVGIGERVNRHAEVIFHDRFRRSHFPDLLLRTDCPKFGMRSSVGTKQDTGPLKLPYFAPPQPFLTPNILFVVSYVISRKKHRSNETMPFQRRKCGREKVPESVVKRDDNFLAATGTILAKLLHCFMERQYFVAMIRKKLHLRG